MSFCNACTTDRGMLTFCSTAATAAGTMPAAVATGGGGTDVSTTLSCVLFFFAVLAALWSMKFLCAFWL